MARLPRLNLADIPQHVIQRGNNRGACFFSDKDYAVYLDKLREFSLKYKIAIHSYVLMTNHVHLLLTPSTEDGVSRLIQTLSSYYVRYVNQTYDRTGTLWEGRYKSCLVDSDDYFLLVSRYIELNPIRAKMVKHPSEYPWSSFHANAMGVAIKLITPHYCYKSLGRSKKLRLENYLSLFDSHIPDFTLEEINDSVMKGWTLGGLKFIKQIEKQTGQRNSPLTRGGDRKSKKYREKQIK
ncbi:Transposase and inactivated derivatives [hydrothermal vent metagenome]|uniref:Transposase and inactivated derivatives n=1 Tax=hydrothermal vent metagenome TaxID=652676 RepID=A0A3B0V9Z3_9ZZZZ